MPNIDQVQLPDGSQYNLKDNISGYVTAQYVEDVIDALTKDNVGLGNVDNTSDLNKPISTAQQTALNGKTDTTVIAPTEATTTASRRYEIGEQFILNGVLYTATAVIASGDLIIVNTNCTLSESITEQIEGKAEKTDLTSISETGSTASQAISKSAIFYLNGTLVRAKTAIASGATFTLNTNYEVLGNGGLNALTRVSIFQALRANVTYTNGLSEDLTSKLASGLESEYFPIQSWVNASAISFISKSINGWRVYMPQSTGYSGTLLTVITGIKIGV